MHASVSSLVSTSRRLSALGAFLLLWFVAVGCDQGASPAGAWTGSVQDSAGVRIVTNPGEGIWTDEDRWTLVEEVRIGVESGDPELQFGAITGVDADDEGRIYVLDQQASRVRVFDSEGDLIRAFGRLGGGPDELSAQAMGLFVDSDGDLLVPDLMNQRLARFSAEGSALASTPLDLTQGIPMLWASAADRTVYAQRRIMAFPGMPAQDADPVDLIVALAPDGTVADTVARMDQGETFRMGSGGMPEIRMFAPEPVWTVLSDGRFVSGLNTRYSLAVHGGDGEAETIVRREFTRRPVTSGQQSSLRRAMLSAWQDAGMPQEFASQMSDMVQFEEEWPALAALLGGPDGTLWVQLVDPDADLEIDDPSDLQNMSFGSPRWDVFDREGRYLGIVEMPEGFMPVRVRGDAIYGVHRDALGIQRVVRLRVVSGDG